MTAIWTWYSCQKRCLWKSLLTTNGRQ